MTSACQDIELTQETFFKIIKCCEDSLFKKSKGFSDTKH